MSPAAPDPGSQASPAGRAGESGQSGQTGHGGPGATTLPTLLVTRPQPQADEWVSQLAQQGLHALALPLLAIAPASDLAAVQRAWQLLPALALVMFVSPNAVLRFFAQRPPGLAWPAGVLAGVTGPGSRRALADAGVPAPLIRCPGDHDPAYAGPFDSEALWPLLAPQAWAGRQALIVRGEGGRDWLAQALRQQGAQVHFVEAYRRTRAVPQGAALLALQAALQAPAQHLWLLSSSEAVGHLPALVSGQPWPDHQALATHPRIAQVAQALGFGRVGLAEPTLAGVAQAVRAGLSAHPASTPANATASAAPIQSRPS